MSKKLKYELMPVEFDDVVLVLMNGAEKYEAHGWEQGIAFERETNLASIKRHITEYRSGLFKDNDSGLHPLLHAACRCLMQYTMDKRAFSKSCVMEVRPNASIYDAVRLYGKLADDNCVSMEDHLKQMKEKPNQHYREDK